MTSSGRDPNDPGNAEDERQLTAEEYTQVFRRHPGGVTVVTFAGAGRPVGFTATSVISVSAAPPILAFSVASRSSAWPELSRATTVVVNFLGSDQVELSTRFATHGIDRFAGTDHRLLPTGEPVLTGALSWVRGRIEQRLLVGDSHLVTLRAILSDSSSTGSPLIYFDRRHHRLGAPFEV